VECKSEQLCAHCPSQRENETTVTTYAYQSFLYRGAYACLLPTRGEALVIACVECRAGTTVHSHTRSPLQLHSQDIQTSTNQSSLFSHHRETALLFISAEAAQRNLRQNQCSVSTAKARCILCLPVHDVGKSLLVLLPRVVQRSHNRGQGLSGRAAEMVTCIGQIDVAGCCTTTLHRFQMFSLVLRP
jgi:hypothetical protein